MTGKISNPKRASSLKFLTVVLSSFIFPPHNKMLFTMMMMKWWWHYQRRRWWWLYDKVALSISRQKEVALGILRKGSFFFECQIYMWNGFFPNLDWKYLWMSFLKLAQIRQFWAPASVMQNLICLLPSQKKRNVNNLIAVYSEI